MGCGIGVLRALETLGQCWDNWESWGIRDTGGNEGVGNVAVTLENWGFGVLGALGTLRG